MGLGTTMVMSFVRLFTVLGALLLSVGIMAQVGQVALTRGMALEPAARATALSYLQVVFAAALGAAIFRDLPDAWTLLGAGVVVSAGLYILRREAMARPVA